MYCESGFGKKFIGNSFSEYQQGEMAFIGKNVPHLFKADNSFYEPATTVKPGSIVIQFLEDFLGPSFFNSREMREMKRVLSLSMNGLMIVGETREKIKAAMFEMIDASKIDRLKGLIEIFGLLSFSNDLQPLSVTTITSSNNLVAIVLSCVWQITVLSPSFCISFPGKRVAAYRAGIKAIVDPPAIEPEGES